MEDTINHVQEKEKRSLSNKIKKYVKNLIDFSSYSKKTILFIIFIIILLIISLYLVYYNVFIDSTTLYRIVIDWFVNPIYNLGIWGIFLFIGIMAIQGLIIPLPSEVVLLATGMIWGWLGGGIMGVIGSVAAGTLCFYISRKGGRPLAEKFVGKKAIDLADRFIHKYGTFSILIGRLIPFIPFDVVSYAGGVVDIDAKKYTFTTFIGSIPRAFFYSVLGASFGLQPPITLSELPLDEIEAQAAWFNLILIILVIVLVIIFIAYYLTTLYLQKKITKENNEK